MRTFLRVACVYAMGVACLGAVAAEPAYERGVAEFAKGDYSGAFVSLAELAPFEQADVGIHARYLIGRIHHLSGERPEAAENYKAAVGEFDRQRKSALGRLADPNLTTEERARLSELVKGSAPEHVARALFYWGVILSEFGSADEAASKFAYAVMLKPDTAVAAEARLRGGICAVAVKKNVDAVALLTPIVEHPQHGAEALRWLAKAQYGAGATPVPAGRGVAAVMNAQPDPARLAAGIREAIATYQKAVAKSAGPARATALLELGDMQQLGGDYKDAAASYAAVEGAGGTADAQESALLRRAVALQLAGDFAESDKTCLAFEAKYPRSSNLAEAKVRHAENALLGALAGKDSADDAAARVNQIIKAYPDSRHAHVARFGLATLHYAAGRYDEAAKEIGRIPVDERVGELLVSSLILADCQLRALPSDEPEDALSSARLVHRLEEIVVPLDAYAATKPFDVLTPDALLRIGYASNRLQAMLADPVEKRRVQVKARRAYATVVREFPQHPLYPVAMLQNAKIIAASSGAAPAVLELSKFQVAPLSDTAIAPLAMISLADGMRARRKPDQAAAILATALAKYEAALTKDPARAPWAAAMKFGHALALKEMGKYDEARAELEAVAKSDPQSELAKEALWRAAQCRLDPVMAAATEALRGAGSAKRTRADVATMLTERAEALRSAAADLDKQVAALDPAGAQSPVIAKNRHDQAWAWHVVGEMEVEQQRHQMRLDAARKLIETDEAQPAAQDRRRPERPRRQRTLEAALASIPPASIPLSSIPLQAAEKKAREAFAAVIHSAGDSPLANEARVELSELYASRGELARAIELLTEALDAETRPDVAERLRLRLASLHLDAGNASAAKSAAEPALTPEAGQGGRNTYATFARVILVEALYRLGRWDAAIEQAAALGEAQRPARLAGVGDHVLLRCAQAQQKLLKWEESRATLETLVSRFGRSTPLLREAQSSLAIAYEKLNQPEKATALRSELAKTTGPDAGNSDALSPRIPNLLTTPTGRSNWSAGNPANQPSPPIATPAVNNIDGTQALAPLKIAARPMEIEVASPPRALALDEEPYTKSSVAPDDREAPLHQ
jgi:tetratricopeptide (TPR) repeat protein